MIIKLIVSKRKNQDESQVDKNDDICVIEIVKPSALEISEQKLQPNDEEIQQSTEVKNN